MARPPPQDWGARGVISRCCSPGFSALQTQLDLKVQFTAGWLNPSQVSYETGLAPELFGLGVSFSPSRTTPSG